MSRRTRPSAGLILAGLVLVTGLLMAPTLTKAFRDRDAESPAVSAVPSAAPTAAPAATAAPSAPAVTPAPVPEPTPAPEPVPTPEPTPAPYDYTKPAPEAAPVDMSYFSDALFIGDSRTDGLQLFSGITGATFYCYKGITVFDVMEAEPRQVLTIDGTKYSIQSALRAFPDRFRKVYLSLGVNELGYYDDQGFHDKFAALIDLVRETQPSAVIYLQNLVPVNPELCEKNWPSYVSNDKVAVYNSIFTELAQEKQVVLVDVAGALASPEGILARDNTVDGVHFTKAWYKEWLSYLMSHTVTP